jgi:uncharacterized membrane protein
MRLHFQEKPWDLYVAVSYTFAMAVVLLALDVGNVLAIFLLLFIPGYIVVAALFPGSPTPEKSEIDWIERIALSFGLSIAVVPLLGLLLNFTPWGIRFGPIVVTLTVFTVGVGYAAYWRRMRLRADKRLSLTVDLGLPAWKEYNVLDKGVTIALGASVVTAGGTLAYVLLTSRPGEVFTEFFILGPGGNASGYPTKLNISQRGSLLFGIANHEAASVSYTIRIDLVGIWIVHNTTSGFNETFEANRTSWSTFNITLADGQNRTQPYTFRINYVGLWKVQFFLFKDNDFTSAYRELHLYVTVK